MQTIVNTYDNLLDTQDAITIQRNHPGKYVCIK